MKTLVYIELNTSDVYVEYDDNDSEHISYSRAKTLLKTIDKPIRYSGSSSQKECDFINSLSRKSYSVQNNMITPIRKAHP